MFKKYLQGFSIACDYEPLVGTKRPLVEVAAGIGSSHALAMVEGIATGCPADWRPA